MFKVLESHFVTSSCFVLPVTNRDLCNNSEDTRILYVCQKFNNEIVQQSVCHKFCSETVDQSVCHKGCFEIVQLNKVYVTSFVLK